MPCLSIKNDILFSIMILGAQLFFLGLRSTVKTYGILCEKFLTLS